MAQVLPHRILFYCHNLHGLGHITRSLRIASATSEWAECRVVTGCRALDQITIDPRVGVHRLPAAKLEDGVRLVASDPSLAHLDVVGIRAEAIMELCRSWKPDAVLVDHNPLGLFGEMMPTVLAALDEGWATRFVWGLPYFDVGTAWNTPPANPRRRRVLQHYSSMIAYMDPNYHAVLEECPAWLRPARTLYAGFVVEPVVHPAAVGEQPLVTVLCGGGCGAVAFCRFVLEAATRRIVSQARFRLVPGPLSEGDLDNALGELLECVEVWPTASVAEAVQGASVCVSRCGYNTVAALLPSNLPLCLVPMDLKDQRVRAERLRGQPGVWVVDESDRTQMTSALEKALTAGLVQGRPQWMADGARQSALWMVREANEAAVTGSM